MSTHGCFAPPFPLFFFFPVVATRDVGAQDPDATFDDDYYYTEGAYYYVEAVSTTRRS